MDSIKERLARYQRAEVTIAALHEKRTKKCYNIYSVVELCTADQLPSALIGDTVHPCFREKLNSEYSLYLRRVFFDNPYRGYDFFTKTGVRPIFADNDVNDILYDYDQMITEPDGDEGILFHHDSLPRHKLEDFLPSFKGTYRIYTQLSKDDSFISELSDDVVLKAGFIIKEHLGINLLKQQEFWGSTFLCLPNPFIKHVKIKLGNEGRKLLVRIIPRYGCELIRGMIEFTDERTWGTGFCCRHEITEDRFVIDIPNEPECLRYRIFTENGELVEESANYFMKKVNFQIGIGTSKRIFKIPNNETPIEVDMKTYIDSSVGNDESSYAKRIQEEEKKRSLAFLSNTHVFNYFPGERQQNNSHDEAMVAIKEIIGKATKRCVLCDPYFSYKDFLSYGVFVSSLDITLHLVTSEKFLKQQTGENDGETQGEKMSYILKQCDKRFAVECHVLLGNERSPLHDRFMVIDEEVYVLGSSFAEFGKRATMLYQIPDPKMLMQDALKWTRNEGYSLSLDEWLSSRC